MPTVLNLLTSSQHNESSGGLWVRFFAPLLPFNNWVKNIFLTVKSFLDINDKKKSVQKISYALNSTVCRVHIFCSHSFLNASMGITNVRDHHSPMLLCNLNYCPFHFWDKTFMNSHCYLLWLNDEKYKRAFNNYVDNNRGWGQ